MSADVDAITAKLLGGTTSIAEEVNDYGRSRQFVVKRADGQTGEFPFAANITARLDAYREAIHWAFAVPGSVTRYNHVDGQWVTTSLR